MFLLFFGVIGFAQNTVTYSSLSQTIDLNSGVEGIVDIVVNCYGNSATPVILNALQSCGNNDGIVSTSYTNGSTLTPGQNTTIRYKFKKTVTANTQIVYKFSTDGSCFQEESKMIKITVNYKIGSTTTPPPVIPPTLIYIGSWPTTSATISEGSKAPTLTGTGAGNYTYQWYKTIDGVFTLIPGATNFYYSPGIPFVTTKYFRQNKLGSVIGSSNEITITVINNAPPVLNNTITIDGVIVTGSLPTGGVGANSYLYSWYVIDEDGDGSELPYSSQSLVLTAPTFTRYFNSPNNFTIKRMVTSGSQYVASNAITVPHISEIQNNIISINNNQVTGSIPTGGMGNYTYSWAIYYTGDPIDFDETTKDLDLTSHLNQINTILQIDSSAKLVRVVTAGISSTSNKLSLNNITATALKKEDTLVSAAYPNPTSGSINFTTSFSSNKEIEIIVYSEELGKTQSIFKGTTAPNQIVQCNIPSNYPKGIYYYKIVSDNKEVKTGKIIFQ